MDKYDSILHETRPCDAKHRPMSLHNRAAQFAPFDALTGFGGRIHEASRLTDCRREIGEDEKSRINTILIRLQEHIKTRPVVTVTYFVPDKTKDGGSYQTITASVIKIDTCDERLILEEDFRIDFNDITDITPYYSQVL